MTRIFARAFVILDRNPERLRLSQARAEHAFGVASVCRPLANCVVAYSRVGMPSIRKTETCANFWVTEGSPRTLDLHTLEGARSLKHRVDEQPGRLQTVGGDFGFLSLTPSRITVVRSCAGLVPWYLYQTTECVAFTTCLQDLVRCIPSKMSLDPLGIAAAVSGCSAHPEQRSSLKGVTVVPIGSFVQLDTANSRLRGERYWFPSEEKPLRVDTASADEELRHLLLSELEETLSPEGPNLLSLSGGVDSSSLGFLAAKTLKRQVPALCLLPPPSTYRDREDSQIDWLVHDAGIGPVTRLTASPRAALLWLQQVENLVVPITNPVLWAISAGQIGPTPRVLFGGEFCDSLLGNFGRTMNDWALQTSASELIAHPLQIPRGLRGLWHWTQARNPLSPGPYPLPHPPRLNRLFREDLNADYEDWLASERQRDVMPGTTRPHLWRRLEAAGWVEMNWEFAASRGFTRAMPFRNRELVEFVLRTAASEHVGAVSKKMLRRSLSSMVPSTYIDRADKGVWGQLLKGTMIRGGETLDDDLRSLVSVEAWGSQTPTLPWWWGLNLRLLLNTVRGLRS